LEYIDLTLHSGGEESIKKNKEMSIRILKREQYYLDLFLPSLNVNKIAGSMLGFKFSDEYLLYSSKIRRGKPSPRSKSSATSSSTPIIVNQETINKLKQRANGVIIKVFDLNDNFISEFPTIAEAAKFYGVSYSTISKYAETGKLWDNEWLLEELFKPINPQIKSEIIKPLSLDEISKYRKKFENLLPGGKRLRLSPSANGLKIFFT
jgi:NUMOD1 domain